MKVEYLKEKGYSFKRIFFSKGGHIDILHTNNQNDPNSNKIINDKLEQNKNTCFIRLNENLWQDLKNVELNNIFVLLYALPDTKSEGCDMLESFTAEEYFQLLEKLLWKM